MRIPLAAHLLAVAAPMLGAETAIVRTELTQAIAKALHKTTVVSGELEPYQRVELHAKVTGFVEAVHVDRGSAVEEGQVLAELSAPELAAQRIEGQAKIAAASAQRAESQARLAAAEQTYQRLSEAAETPGAVAAHDVILAEKAVEAERARLDSLAKTIAALEAAVRVIEETEKYLQVKAPFAGVITERHAHVGALAGPEGNPGPPLFTLEQVARLRLVAAIPEAYAQSIVRGRQVQFTVSAYPAETFAGTVARPAYAVDPETRTMPVELDYANPDLKLAPGMYAAVQWPVRRAGETLFVPPTAIRATTERIFVIKVADGRAEWVDVRRGMTEGDLTEVFGDLAPEDWVVLRATDEIRPGTQVEAR